MNTRVAAPATTTRHYVGALLLAVGCGVTFYSQYASGVVFWIVLTVGSISFCLFVRYLLSELRPAGLTSWANITLVIASTLLTLTACEVVLVFYAQLDAGGKAQSFASAPLLVEGSLAESARKQMLARQGVLTMPAHWARQPVADAPGNYLWHGVLHRHDQNRFRRDTPIPAKRADVFRIVVLGDSLTYGYGVAEENTYSSILERLLARGDKVELLNLGVGGFQSADILEVLRTTVPELAPDLVVYGMCLNDFLPSGMRQYAVEGHAFPLPEAVKTYFIKRTQFGRLIADLYDRLLLQLGVRVSFMDDILADFEGYQARFARDVVQMSDLMQPGVPLVGMVLHQFPELDGQAHRAAQIAEQHMRSAGIDVVDSQTYFTAYDGQRLGVSQWEGHPNELAHALYASMLLPRLQAVAGL